MAANHDWWAKHRSAEQAARWYVAAYEAMRSLAETAARNPLARERELRQLAVRQFSFGLSRRPTHRILYAVRGNDVVIYRVRAFRQDELSVGDLGQ
ncbi:MAG: type II toxin-antitoxin system RelE/ParE family toxin [Pirellulales bacterium]|nr:type II toxin-antitoxin system RelE/ParE family toxin [Pirellulales bacterium]